ncbi:MAG: hypothetical protein ACYCW6_03860 [Candidatus Xenobia bacterium]
MLAAQATSKDTVFHETRMLSAEEGRDVRDAVEALRGGWHRRFPTGEFYTLGMSSYLDAFTPEAQLAYRDGSRIANPILWRRLGWLYRRIQNRLSAILSAPVLYRPDCALPGFHIFHAHPDMEIYPCSIHIDLQYTNLSWQEFEKADFNRTISFTLSVTLPREGAGLNVWEEHHRDQMQCTNRTEFMQKVSAGPPTFHVYTEGSMVVHSGHLVHQMTLGNIAQEGERVTLQGHGVWCDGAWQLYW